MTFPKLKALFHIAAHRTADGFWEALGDLLDRFTQNERINYFSVAGYDLD